MPKNYDKQINVSIHHDWFSQLERLARIYSVQEEQDLSVLDLIRSAIQEKYSLSIEDDSNEPKI